MGYHARAAIATFGAALLAAAYPAAALPLGLVALVTGSAWVWCRPEAALGILLVGWGIRIPLRGATPAAWTRCLVPPGALAPGPGAGAGLHLALSDLLLLPALAAVALAAWRRRSIRRPAPLLLPPLLVFVAANLYFTGGWARSQIELLLRLYLLDATLLLLLLAGAPSRGALAWAATGWVLLSLAGLALYPGVDAWVREGIRYAGMAGGANVLGLLLAVAFALLVRDRTALAVLALPALLLCRSRAGLLAALAGGAVALAPRGAPRSRWLFLLPFPFLYLHFSASHSLPDLVRRLALPADAGVGLAVPVGLSTHGRLWAETGSWGLGALALWFLLSLRAARPDQRAALSALGVFSLFHETLRHPVLYLLLAMPFFPSDANDEKPA